ncbi:amino acid adenylation domain-containing protein [Nannocystaceae bacterium ST9]
MTLDELMIALRAAGVRVWAEADRLHYDAPRGALSPALLEQLRAHKPALLDRLRAGLATRIPRRRDRDRWPLSPEQVRLWLADRLAPEAAAYNMPLVLRLRGGWTRESIAAALAELGERHPILTTRIEQAGERLEQVIGEPPILTIASADEPLAELAARAAARPFDLTREPPLRACLVELGAGERALLLTLHHVAGDEQSLLLLVESLAASLGLIPPPPASSEALEFGDFASWQREQLDAATPALADRAARWSAALAGLEPLELAGDRPRRPLPSGQADMIEFEVPARTLARLDALAAELHASRFAIVSAALGLVCARWTGQLDVPLATPISARGLPGLARSFGLLLETSVLRVRVDRAASVRALIVGVRDEILAALERGPLPLERIVEHDAGALLRVLVTDRPALTTRIAGLEVHEQVRATAKAELALTTHVHEGRLIARLEYDRELYDRSTLASFADSLARTLEHFGDPDASLASLALADPSAEPPLASPPFTRGVAATIVAQAERTPDAIAVAGDDFELSYRACRERALSLAHWLRERVGASTSEPRVAICLERGAELVPCMLAVLAAGLVHVPIDPRLPDARRRRLIERSGARVLISSAALVETLAATLADEVELVLVDRPGPWRERPELAPERLAPIAVAPEQLAYLIYTSGSTGEPKGVAITQRSVAARMDWAVTRHGAAELAGVLAASSVAFDLSVFEIFAPLCAGGTVILARDPLALPEHRQRARVRLVDTVPSAIAALLRAGGLPDSIGWINLAGEALQRELVAALRERNPERRVVNLYGPAEDTTFSTCATIEPGSGPADLGRALPGTSVHLLDVAGQPAPRGAVGELFLAGVGLARGYDREPSASAARFVPDRFGPPGARMYRSGDLARRDSSGALLYRGRKDRQLKLRGVRIEPGEIEALLARLEGMVEVALVPLPDARAPERLVALCRVRPDAPLDLDRIRAACARELPRSHQPQPILVDALPRTASGKLDLAAIAALAGELRGPEQAIRPPSSELEARLRERWAELLGIPATRISVDADLFSLGAHSLLIPSLLAWIQTELGVRLPVRAAFEQRSVEALARVVEAALAERDAELLALLDEVEGLSDDEVRRLLAED